ncbi:MAG: response regulator [Candidatus Abyssobacteria bacterium SURF_17]|uniref:histidine kinase n=1 Tax=Candidatus Abyssobacteria bacterium SURF_17 TaxID=2093361 RepID=A0A419F0G4_9BACT|nr:MAG: response regulator [Candidatus Abyssubacteria bacterium SURF_17]
MMDETFPENVEKQIYADALRKATHDYEELVAQLSVLRLLNDSFQAGSNFYAICQQLVHFMTEAMDVENASVMLVNHERGELRLAAAKSFCEDEGSVFVGRDWSGKAFRLGEGIAGKVAQSRKSILINDTHKESSFVKAERQKVSVRSILSLPLLHGDLLHGVLNLSNSEPGTFDKKKEYAFNLIASTASVALSYASAVEQLRQANEQLESRNRELAAIVAVSESLHSNLELDAVLDASLRNVLEGFDFDVVGVFLRSKSEGVMELKSYRTLQQIPDIESYLQKLITRFSDTIASSLSPATYFRTFTDSPDEGAGQSPHRVCVGIPLSNGDDCFGLVLALTSRESELDEDRTRLLSSFCNQISLAIHNSALISRLKENIRELQETKHQLIQSDKLALLGEMLSGVAHEINNPLAAIMGYSDLLLSDTSLSEDHHAMLKKILRSVDRSRKIVHGLLSFARKTEIQRRETNVIQLIERVLEHRNYDFSINNIEVVKKYESDTCIAAIDPNQMEQVFLNLVNNAFDAMYGRELAGKLEIKTRLTDDPAVHIEFSDNGHGVREADRNKVFEPFFTTKEVGKGTGLGLSISYGIVKEHGGELSLDDAYHDGARFIVKLPVVSIQPSIDDGFVRREAPELNGGRGRVLVVDDEEVVRDFIKVALTSDGFVVDCADDGQAAYETLHAGEYDVVITDLRMPGALDGRRLFLKVHEDNPKLAEGFIFITGDIMEKDANKFLKESGRNFLLKPFALKDLREVVNKTFGNLTL